MSVNYTRGGYEVSSLYQEPPSEYVNRRSTYRNVVYDTSFTLLSRDDTEATYIGRNGASIRPYEYVRIGRQPINNIYANTKDSSAAAKLADQNGVQVMVEMKLRYNAKSTTTGIDYDLPVTARFVLRLPNNSAVSEEIIKDATLRLIALLGTQRTSAEESVDRDYSQTCATVTNAVVGNLVLE